MSDNFLESSKAFLGRGWAFPPTFTKGGNEVKMLEAEEDIKNSLEILMSTTIGERVMLPEYGCNLDRQVFQTLDVTFQTYLTEQIRTAIVYHEPRVNLDSVEYDDDALNGKIDITINFTVISTNTRYNIVYPFFLEEGTDLSITE
ncbi:MAG: GPW/gp25 family protein [Flavobacteriales bacterium]|nr:GPW/gp25 family protein [Flavobacteriales bacterium]